MRNNNLEVFVFEKKISLTPGGEESAGGFWRQKPRRMFYKLLRDNEVVKGKRTDLRLIGKV